MGFGYGQSYGGNYYAAMADAREREAEAKRKKQEEERRKQEEEKRKQERLKNFRTTLTLLSEGLFPDVVAKHIEDQMWKDHGWQTNADRDREIMITGETDPNNLPDNIIDHNVKASTVHNATNNNANIPSKEERYNKSRMSQINDSSNWMNKFSQNKLQGSKIDQVKQLQKIIGVTPDGMWGTKSQAAFNVYRAKIEHQQMPEMTTPTATVAVNGLEMTKPEILVNRNGEVSSYLNEPMKSVISKKRGGKIDYLKYF